MLVGLEILPATVLESDWFSVLARFVAVNTILYVALSIFKIAPKLYLSDVLRRSGRRSETRSIHPDAPIEPIPVRAPRRSPGPDDAR